MKLGDLTYHFIRIITFGQGKRFATWVAKKFGYDDCGCERRRKKMNKWI